MTDTTRWLDGAEPDDPLLIQLLVATAKTDPVRLTDLLPAVVAATAAARDTHPDTFAAYERQQIRKLARSVERRKFTAACDELVGTSEQPGVTVSPARHGSAHVAVVGPLLRSTTPDPVRRGQLTVSASRFTDDLPEAPAASTAPTLLVAVSPLLEMSPLKLTAQVAHAAQVAHLHLAADPTRAGQLAAWRATGWAATGFRPTAADWPTWAAADVVIRDAGHTEIPAGSHTVSATLHRP